jgi:uncharacterized protein YodC (DUF2158 family)
MTEIKAGSIVKLKSGGPKMTSVEGPDQEGRVECQWFSASKKLEVNRFRLSSLVIVEESEGRVIRTIEDLKEDEVNALMKDLKERLEET